MDCTTSHLAVKKRTDIETLDFFDNTDIREVYEVIDGQQRLTTIHLILKIIDNSIYKIKYQTRKESAAFLDKVEEILGEYSIISELSGLDIYQIETSINEQWKNFVAKTDGEFDNIDIYHFFGAFLVIKSWFSKKEKTFIVDFLQKLKQNTQFIWYEDTKEQDSKKVFRNLNSGKIPLTNAELIKGLFINSQKDNNREIQKLKQTELASEWNQIEQALHDPSFWFFINNETDENKYQTRIDFLFELIVGEAKDKNDELHSYRQYSEKKVELNWQKVKIQFLQLKEWFEDKKLYHLIGFIICRKIKQLNEIIEESNDADGKDDFYKILKTFINAEFKKEGKKNENEETRLVYDLENLNYQEYYNETTSILLLFNIETYQKSEANYRFPFDYFKNEKWSLEHIHAQNAKDFETNRDIKAWVTDIDNLLKNWQEKEELIPDEFNELVTKLNNIIDNENSISTENRIILTHAMEYTDAFFDIHSIKNLALLDGNTNSSFGNKAFKGKREELIKIDKLSDEDKHFIPLCTKNVFLKYYTKEINQMEYWGYNDREDYLEDISKCLSEYLPKKGLTK